MISFYNQEQVALAFEVAQDVALDNGAFSLWKAGRGRIDIPAYTEFVEHWRRHPAFAWCVIPDIIDGTEEENNELIQKWTCQNFDSVPVWHMHESLEKLGWLVDEFPRVAIGSSGDFAKIRSKKWWPRIAEAMTVACDADGFPRTKLHGLRQLDPRVFSVVPYSSVDSCSIGRNVGLDSNWTGSYVPKSKKTRALVLRDNISHHAQSRRWPGIGGIQQNWELFG